MKHTEIIQIYNDISKYISNNIVVCGWIRTTRKSKNITFIEINDGSTIRNLQLVLDTTDKEESDVCSKLNVGTSIKAEGLAVASERNIVEIQISKIKILGECAGDYPLQKKHHTTEFLRTIPHLRSRTRYFEAVYTLRSGLAMAIHEYFAKNGYKYIHTPIITASDCEGAGEMFRVTTNNWNLQCDSEEEYYKKDFFGKKVGLTVSCQLEGEMLAMGLGKVYTFGPTFRAEHSNTTRHIAEFWQVEPEVMFAEIDDIIEIAEDFIKYIIRYIMNNYIDEISFCDKWISAGLIDKLNNVINNEFAKIDYTEAIEVLSNADVKFDYPVYWGCDLQTEHEKYLTDIYYNKPVFVINYPKEQKAFYMKQNDDGKTVAATDLLVPGIGEIIGCSEREDDYDKLIAAMIERNMPIENYSYYLDTRKYGSAPHSGFGLGFDRMLMYITGVTNIRDAALFPRTVGNLIY